jgi:hypothetical protein
MPPAAGLGHLLLRTRFTGATAIRHSQSGLVRLGVERCARTRAATIRLFMPDGFSGVCLHFGALPVNLTSEFNDGKTPIYLRFQ